MHQSSCPVPGTGYWCRPTLFTGVSQSSRVVQEEIFGPVLAIQTFRTFQEALDKANNTPYGLSGGVWTDKGAKIFRMTRAIRAGVVWANTFNKFDPTSPVRRLQGKRHGPRGRSARARCLRGAHLMAARAGKRPNGAPAAPKARANGARARVPVAKTYKLYVDGKFPRSESGRYYPLERDGRLVANVCRASRKDFRDAVVAARNAFADVVAGERVSARPDAVSRGGDARRPARAVRRRARAAGSDAQPARAAEVTATIDRLVYYAGWADKYQQVFSSVNPVATSHFNFSVLEPTGVVAIIAPEASGLLGLVSNVAPAVAGGNTCVVLASQIAAARRREPGRGAAGLGHTRRRRQHADRAGATSSPSSSPRTWTSTRSCTATRMPDTARRVQLAAADNIKRVVLRAGLDWNADESQSPYLIRDTQETKTTWHPIGA